MLGAQVNALTSQLLVDMLSVRSSQLDVYIYSLNAIILVSTALYLGAFTVWGGYLFPIQHDHWNYPARWVYHTVVIAGMMAQFVCLNVSIFVVIMAPGLALRGPAGSMDKAIAGMRYWTEKLSQLMLVGLALFQVALITYCWTQEPEGDDEGNFVPFPYYLSGLANAAFLLGILLAAWYSKSIINLLGFDQSLAADNTDLTGAAARFANQAVSNDAINAKPAPPQPQQAHYQPVASFHTPDSALAESAIKSVATKPKAKGFWKQIWDGKS